MKIMCLNTWCGRTEGIYDFFKKYKDVDIFCLQEVDMDGTKFSEEVTGPGVPEGDPKLFWSIGKILTEHHGFFSPILESWWGNAIFIKKDLYRKVTASGELVVSDQQQKYMDYNEWFRRSIQWIDFETENGEYTIINIHALWEKDKGKNDSPDRIEQSQNIINFMQTKQDRKIILVGDFNLNPETQSIKMIEEFGMVNLIRENNITDTRTELYKKDGRFADYAFCSKGVDMIHFTVLSDVVSDHAPLFLELN